MKPSGVVEPKPGATALHERTIALADRAAVKPTMACHRWAMRGWSLHGWAMHGWAIRPWAVGLLSRREHSARELKRKLEARGIQSSEVDAALERLQKAGLQDEQRFAESLLRQRVMAGYGPYYLRAELATHGLAESLIDQLIEQLTEAGEIDWTAVAADLVKRRFSAGLSDPKQRRRAQSLLHRRGFDAETAREVLG